jgi:hypothetical protein
VVDSAVTSITWVIITYDLTLIESFSSDLTQTIQLISQGIIIVALVADYCSELATAFSLQCDCIKQSNVLIKRHMLQQDLGSQFWQAQFLFSIGFHYH